VLPPFAFFFFEKSPLPRLLCAMLCNVFLSFALAFSLFGLQRLLYLPWAIIVEYYKLSSPTITSLALLFAWFPIVMLLADSCATRHVPALGKPSGARSPTPNSGCLARWRPMPNAASPPHVQNRQPSQAGDARLECEAPDQSRGRWHR